MENSALFNETELKLVIYCAAMMSSIDKEVHDREWDAIQSFADKHWKDMFGDFVEFQKRIFTEINDLLKDESALYEKVDTLTTELGQNLSSEQRKVILGLLGDVIDADNVLAIEETNLFAAFIKRLGKN